VELLSIVDAAAKRLVDWTVVAVRFSRLGGWA